MIQLGAQTRRQYERPCGAGLPGLPRLVLPGTEAGLPGLGFGALERGQAFVLGPVRRGYEDGVRGVRRARRAARV
ncbi:predicted protein [Streptomyces sp. C]|nr:predicted protein [Streptomyces sp. C]